MSNEKEVNADFFLAPDNSIYEEAGGTYWVKRDGKWVDTGIPSSVRTSGRPRKVHNIDLHKTDTFKCSGCKNSYLWRMSPNFDHCPGCGGEIQKG